MKSFLALIRREYLEHRGAFLYAPAALVLLMAASVVMMAVSGRHEMSFAGDLPNLLKVFEVGFGGLAGAWWVYLLITLFFFISDTFSSDRRNNSMLFWKSMPQSDLKILVAKYASGLTLFPVLVFVALLLSGGLVYVVTLLGGATPGLTAPSFPTVVAAYGQIALAALVFFGLGLLWYAPYFAWVGGLSTLFGRWSVPLAFLIPIVAMGLENLLLDSPTGGVLWAYLSSRFDYGPDYTMLWVLLLNPLPFDANGFIARLWDSIDWVAMLTGWVFAAAVIFVASEYRRRVLSA